MGVLMGQPEEFLKKLVPSGGLIARITLEITKDHGAFMSLCIKIVLCRIVSIVICFS